MFIHHTFNSPISGTMNANNSNNKSIQRGQNKKNINNSIRSIIFLILTKYVNFMLT